ncbi:MAG: hypothetical protein VBE63_00120 [Lamprobacter sp.]|uniref:GT99 family glycosyltransferase N-terminal domain-containing protein n=1 Tax=Lamprobacter sp. TaxID=3100796 RepID=UPI002B2598FE|nr:hypothetical protein [Lamprobacter sp.]MEA3638331.1 hypothetical protein [Lamprobacter sp.]
MFISFLYPFPLRGLRAPFLWVAFKQMGDLGADQVAFIASDDYFVDPERYRRMGRFDCHAPVNPELGFRVPTHAEADGFARGLIPDQLYQRLKARLLSDTLVWRHLITEVDDELVELICEQVERLSRHAPCEALLTWCNYASLSEAATRLGLPLLHGELGPLRTPWYRPLGYLDFIGVNGHTEAAARWQASAPLANAFADIPSLRAALRLYPLPDHIPEAVDARLGIPLQVEDDSNVLAYGNGFDMWLLIQYAREEYEREDLLIRPHPGAHLSPSGDFRLDDSPDSAAFVNRCERLLTLNSSVAVEAMLMERPVSILGDSPARHLAGHGLDDARLATLAELEFLLLNYFVPYDLLFDAEYLRWRLRRPSEAAIRARHLQTMTVLPTSTWSSLHPSLRSAYPTDEE